MLSKKAQVTLETTLALIAMLLLFVGTGRIFIWLNNSLVGRQQAFHNSRYSFTNADFYTPSKLRVLADEEGRDDLAYTFNTTIDIDLTREDNDREPVEATKIEIPKIGDRDLGITGFQEPVDAGPRFEYE